MWVRDSLIAGLCIVILVIPFYITEYIKGTMEKDDIGYIKLEEKVTSNEESDSELKVYIAPTGECYHFEKSCADKNATETTLGKRKKEKRACRKCVQ